VVRRGPPARDRSREDLRRSPPAQHGTARRPLGNHPAGGAARFFHHARQGEPVGAGDGEPGVLPGPRVRSHDRSGGRGRSARAERDDARDRVERAPRREDPDECARRVKGENGARHSRRSATLAGVARSQHCRRDRAEPICWIRCDRGDRQRISRDRPADPRAGARAGPALASRSRSHPLGRSDDHARGRGR
jgi:hypothetical protein